MSSTHPAGARRSGIGSCMVMTGIFVAVGVGLVVWAATAGGHTGLLAFGIVLLLLGAFGVAGNVVSRRDTLRTFQPPPGWTRLPGPDAELAALWPTLRPLSDSEHQDIEHVMRTQVGAHEVRVMQTLDNDRWRKTWMVISTDGHAPYFDCKTLQGDSRTLQVKGGFLDPQLQAMLLASLPVEVAQVAGRGTHVLAELNVDRSDELGRFLVAQTGRMVEVTERLSTASGEPAPQQWPAQVAPQLPHQQPGAQPWNGGAPAQQGWQPTDLAPRAGVWQAQPQPTFPATPPTHPAQESTGWPSQPAAGWQPESVQPAPAPEATVQQHPHGTSPWQRSSTPTSSMPTSSTSAPAADVPGATTPHDVSAPSDPYQPPTWQPRPWSADDGSGGGLFGSGSSLNDRR